MQIPVVLNESNKGEIFWLCASFNMAVYAIVTSKLEINGTLLTLQPESSQSLLKYEVDQCSMNSLSFIVFHYYFEGAVDVAHYTTTNALFNT